MARLDARRDRLSPSTGGAILESLIESELFGHVKGSFTGAHETRAGKFVQASGGTLSLDEIGELPLAMQVKLLRVLQEREVTPIGDTKARAIDVRIVAATNVDLEAMVGEGRFRQDLYYRLEVLPVHLPALRERAADIVPLARHFLDAANRRLGTTVALAEDALALLKLHQWPGNVREMENAFERLVILSRTGTITAADLPAKMRTGTGPSAVKSPRRVGDAGGGGDRSGGHARGDRGVARRAGPAPDRREQDPRGRDARAQSDDARRQAQAPLTPDAGTRHAVREQAAAITVGFPTLGEERQRRPAGGG